MFVKQVSSWNAIPVPNTKYIVFSHSETEYEEAIKIDDPYIYHHEIKNKSFLKLPPVTKCFRAVIIIKHFSKNLMFSYLLDYYH